jgi:hypothetical protein
LSRFPTIPVRTIQAAFGYTPEPSTKEGASVGGFSSITDTVTNFTGQISGEASNIVGDFVGAGNDAAAPVIEQTQELAQTVPGSTTGETGDVLSFMPLLGGGGIGSFQILAIGAVAIAAIMLLRK